MQVTLELIDAVRNLSFDEALRYLVGTLYPEVLDPLRAPGVVLCVQPHPDDCEFGAGGAIALLGRSGRDIYYVTVTDGRMGTSNPNLYPEELARIRRREQEEAAGLPGVLNIMWFDFMDTNVPVNDLRNRLITEIRRLKPSIVIAPDPYTRSEAHKLGLNTKRLELVEELISKNSKASVLFLSATPHRGDDYDKCDYWLYVVDLANREVRGYLNPFETDKLKSLNGGQALIVNGKRYYVYEELGRWTST
jgi:hypothetical protein